MSQAVVWTVTTTTPTREDARRIAREVVERKLAGSADITGPAATVFWHLGELGEGEEYRLTLKTSVAVRDTLLAAVLELHPWDNPDIAATPVEISSPRYVAWMESITGSQES
jgi:periplasmic divalent cation tolerance protein